MAPARCSCTCRATATSSAPRYRPTRDGRLSLNRELFRADTWALEHLTAELDTRLRDERAPGLGGTAGGAAGGSVLNAEVMVSMGAVQETVAS